MNTQNDQLEMESTLSGQSNDFAALLKATQSLANQPNIYQQTRYLDEIQEILRKRKKTKHLKAKQFLQELEIRRSEAVAQNLLSANLAAKQDSTDFESQIEVSRQALIHRQQNKLAGKGNANLFGKHRSTFDNIQNDYLRETDESNENSEEEYDAKMAARKFNQFQMCQQNR